MDNISLAYEPPVMKEDGTAGFAATLGFFVLGVANLFVEGISKNTLVLPLMALMIFFILFYHFNSRAGLFKERLESYNNAYDKKLSDIGEKKLREMIELGAFNGATKDRILSFLSKLSVERRFAPAISNAN